MADRLQGLGELKLAGDINAWDHIIEISHDGEIRCQWCDEEQEVPDIIMQSSPFVQTVYKLHLLSEFKHTSCHMSPFKDGNNLSKERIEGIMGNKINTPKNYTKLVNEIEKGKRNNFTL